LDIPVAADETSKNVIKIAKTAVKKAEQEDANILILTQQADFTSTAK